MIKEVLQIIFLFILPVVLIKYNIISTKYRFYVLSIIVLSILSIILYENWSLQDLGLDLISGKSGWFNWIIFTLLGIIVISIFAKYHGNIPIKNWWNHYHFQYGFILLSIAQQFLFQGFLTNKLLKIIPSTIAVIIIVALIFTFLHVIYIDFNKVSIIIFLAGVSFTFLYLQTHNLYAAMFSHMVLNFTIILYQFLTIK